MSGMDGIHNGPGMTPGYQGPVDGTQDPGKAGVNGSADVTPAEAAQAITELRDLFRKALTVSTVDDTTGATREIGIPELDEADAELAAIVDLEVLVALLKADMDETQLAAAKDRIDAMKGKLDQQHKTQLEKIEKAIEKAREQERAAKASRAFGWIGAIFAVVSAIVLTVTTGGLAAGFAIAGAVVAVTSLVLTETGADKIIMDAMAESLMENEGWSKEEAEEIAQGLYAGVQMVLCLGCAIGGGCASAGQAAEKFAEKFSEITLKVIRITMSSVGGVISAGGMSSGLASAIIGYQAGMAQADVTETQAILNKLQKILEENQDDLQQLLQMMNDNMSSLVTLLESKINAALKILQEMGQPSA